MQALAKPFRSRIAGALLVLAGGVAVVAAAASTQPSSAQADPRAGTEPVAAWEPGPRDICRSGLAIAKFRKLGEMKVEEESQKDLRRAERDAERQAYRKAVKDAARRGLPPPAAPRASPREGKETVLTVSFVPWPDAPPDARVFHCKVVGKSMLWREKRPGKSKWSGERVAYTVDEAAQTLTLKVTFSTGKSRSKTYAFQELQSACNGCEGHRAASHGTAGTALKD